MMATTGPIVAFVIISFLTGGVHSAQYFGKFIGKLSELHHGVSGEVYAVDGRTLYLKDFTYDGQGPAAYFYASTSRGANSQGFRLRDENGSPEVIRRYRKEGVTLTLPEGKTLNNIKIFYVWCEEFEVNFGDVKIPRNFDYPRPQKIEPLKGVHAISSDNIVIVDAQTLLIPNLSYDGEAPDAKFWVGRGPKPSPQGVRVPDENGKEVPLRRYDRKTVVLTLPGDLTVFDIGHFGIWCEAFTVDFGHVQIPQNLNVPPSLKMLGVSPQSKLNCEVLYDDLAFEVRWAVAGDSIVLQLVAKLEDGEYVSFGISGDDSKSKMIGGDAVVAWVDKGTLKGYAEDYHLGAKSQCSGPTGSCPDNVLKENSNNVRLLNAAMVNGYSIVTYQRPLKPSDEYDRQIHTNRSQAIIWAIGPLNQRKEVSFHNHFTKGDQFLDFGRPAKWNCPMPEGEQPPMKPVSHVRESVPTTTTTLPPPPPSSRSRNSERRRGGNRGSTNSNTNIEVIDNERSASRTRQTERRGNTRRGSNNSVRAVPTPAPVAKRDAWDIPAIQCYEPEDGVFYAQMGPTGGKRGYPAITGHVGWGISWYINGLLIPEINVIRGKTYTFVVEGGFDPEVAAKYHPFYITDDPVGGYEYKTAEERKKVRIFAGAIAAKDGTVKPTGTGRLCHWTHQGDLDADDFESFGAYQRTLELKCDQGEPGVIQWTPDKNTPNTVYYQCFTHRYLGWKINVHDSCDTQGAASESKASVVPAPDLEESPSIRIETRVKPNAIPVEDKEDKNNNTTVSAKDSVPPVTNPPLLNEPVLIQPQETFINPQIYMSHGPLFTTYNPYMFENSFFYNPYQQSSYQQQSFKPSPLISSVREDFQLKSQPSSETPKEATTVTYASSTSTASTTTTTTAAALTTTEKFQTSTITTVPEISEKITVDFKPIDQSFLTPPAQITYPKTNFVMRRPPGSIIKRRPYQSMRPVIMRAPLPHKKTIYRPPMKISIARPPPLKEPLLFSETRTKLRRPTNFVMMKPPPVPPKPTKVPTSTITPPTVTVKNVEISPQQISTEKEPEVQTIPSPLVEIKPTKESYTYNLRPAMNTGFHPESLIIESGFKPIISKEFQKRVSQDEPELEYESEIGVIDHRQVPQLPQNFEPVFVPSPIDKPGKRKLYKRPYIKKVIIKHSRSLADDDVGETSSDEPIPAAAERVESYYLPPQGQAPEISQRSRQPSNIDIERPSEIDLASPPDIVVTYDGRRVSGASLTARPADRSSILDMRASKAAELIKARPQFAPFKGELPPLNPDVINKNAPQLKTRGLISRDLDTPPVSTGGSTKLSLVRQIVENERELHGEIRTRRAAHHTPEHTAQQKKNGTLPEDGRTGVSHLS